MLESMFNGFTKESAMAQGMKEFLEVVHALDVAVDTYVKVMEDGKIDFNDVKDLPELLVAARAAVQGFKDVVVEVKDATPEEMAAALVAVVALAKKVFSLVHKE